MIYSFKGVRPVVALSSFVHPQAAVTGNVIIGENASGSATAPAGQSENRQGDPSQPLSDRSGGTSTYKPWKETRND
jgi:hypothetical protein